MSQPMQSTLKLGLIVATALVAGIAGGWVLDLLDAELARELALKSVYLSAIFIAAGLLVGTIAHERVASAPLTDGRR